MSAIVPAVVVPTAIDVITKALGRPPTQAEMIDLAPIAVMVQAFIAAAQPGDELRFEAKSWAKSYGWGAYETTGQQQKVKVRKAEQ